MAVYIALLRAVNVGGTGKLPMSELKAMCEKLGFAKVRTYIASGNVIFESPQSESQVKTLLEDCLKQYIGKPVGVIVRTPGELQEVLFNNPFPKAAANRTVTIFLNEPPPGDALNDVKGRQTEEIQLGKREIYINYGEGMASSKLQIGAARTGTARNMNTVAKLFEIASTL